MEAEGCECWKCGGDTCESLGRTVQLYEGSGTQTQRRAQAGDEGLRRRRAGSGSCVLSCCGSVDELTILTAGVIKTGFGGNAASYREGVNDNNTAIEEEFCMSYRGLDQELRSSLAFADPNLPEILENRRKMLYEGASSNADVWAKQQVDVMTRSSAPAYWVSGA